MLVCSSYSGTAGDAMTNGDFHTDNNALFSTFDADHSGASINCAAANGGGGWWYSYLCGYAFPNSHMKDADITGIGAVWMPLTGYQDSLTFIEIKIKQIS